MSATSAADYGYLRQLVMHESQNVLDPSRDYLFETRLWGLMQRLRLTSLEELVRRLRAGQSPGLKCAVVEAMTINETSFLGDMRVFELLRMEVLPRLVESRGATRRLRLWSAASSTGQEAYSAAILIREHFPHLASWDIRIEGTDLSEEVVMRARQGRYHRIEMNRGLPARLLVRYFDRIGEERQVRSEVAALCNFRRANLSTQLPFFEQFDIILLRNVLIYFSRETRLNLLAGIRRLMAPGGYLFLGSAEQVPDQSLWTATVSGGACYYTQARLPEKSWPEACRVASL
jgi:chemotaxis protein methyltransferase CheR